jgi:hypothetical protein
MSDIDLIGRIVALTKCGTHIGVNEHRNYYEPVGVYLDHDDDPRIPPDVRRVMVETDTIVEITCYVTTPVGSVVVYHHDLTAALTEMLRILEGK